MPRLVFFPPFCISLSLPTDTALKANICSGQRWAAGARAGRGGPLTHAEHDPVREEGFEGYAHGCEGLGGRWAMGVRLEECRRQLAWVRELPGLTNVGTWVCEGLGTASIQEASSSRRQNLTVHALSRLGRSVARVARRCRFLRIAKTRTLRPQPPRAGAHGAPAATNSCTATTSAPPTRPHLPAPWQPPRRPHCISLPLPRRLERLLAHVDAPRRPHDATHSMLAPPRSMH